mmetsp:Transcript_9362/g.38400  ORF Transcript_9362/g.38400 Transcript_9362/m.38400 type:complete len:232 (-) Transcript_9362:314-1009(-)
MSPTIMSTLVLSPLRLSSSISSNVSQPVSRRHRPQNAPPPSVEPLTRWLLPGPSTRTMLTPDPILTRRYGNSAPGDPGGASWYSRTYWRPSLLRYVNASSRTARSRKFAPATRHSISSSLLMSSPRRCSKRLVNLCAPPPVALIATRAPGPPSASPSAPRDDSRWRPLLSMKSKHSSIFAVSKRTKCMRPMDAASALLMPLPEKLRPLSSTLTFLAGAAAPELARSPGLLK